MSELVTNILIIVFIIIGSVGLCMLMIHLSTPVSERFNVECVDYNNVHYYYTMFNGLSKTIRINERNNLEHEIKNTILYDELYIDTDSLKGKLEILNYNLEKSGIKGKVIKLEY